MVSILGGGKDNHRSNGSSSDNEQGSGEPPAPAFSQVPDERTRLLPPQSHEPYLSPDDPAVSPYNLWSVRVLRYFTVFFAGLTFLWWTLLFISIFVSPPGMHSRGSGFFDVSYSTLTLGHLFLALIFFATPSKADQVLHGIIAVLLLVDILIIVAVPQLRAEEGGVGIASVVWAFVIALWNVLTDRYVTWGKHEEEERLTGRSETRRTLKEWLSVLISTILLVVFAIVVILLTATLIIRARDASLEPLGERYYVDNDKYRLHLFCEGNKTDSHGETLPTVLFEAGEEPFERGLYAFARTAIQNGTFSRYCFADRPGFGWSENAPSPFSAGMATDVLSEALARAGEEGPWVLASAGVGSIYSRIFSSRHGQDVAGLLLIDPLHEDLLYKLGAPRRGFLLWARGFISPLGLNRIPGAIFNGRTREDRVYGRVAYQNGKYIKAKLQESLVAESLTRSEVASARTIQMRQTPLVLVSSGIQVRKSNEWEKRQRDLTHLTENLHSWDIVNKADHRVWETNQGSDIIEKRLGELVRGESSEKI